MFIAMELQTSGVYISLQSQGIFKTSEQFVRGREITLHDENIAFGCAKDTFVSASNYATSLCHLQRFEEAKAMFRKTVPVARRVLGESDDLTLKMRWTYAMALYKDPDTSLGDLREAMETLESVAPVWTRIFGEAHPETPKIQAALANARVALAARAA